MWFRDCCRESCSTYLISHLTAEERVDLPMNSEVTKSCGVHLRRYSTGNASSENSEEKVVPRYLRASIGSCHDICKYGRNHEFEVKMRHSIPESATGKPLHKISEDSIGGIMTSGAKLRESVDSKLRKMSMIKLSESVDFKLHISYTSDTNKQELPTKLPDIRKQIGNGVLVNENKTLLTKDKPSFLPKSHLSSIPKTRRQGVSSTFKVETPSKSTSKKVEPPLKSTSKKVEPPSKSTSQMVRTSSKSTSKVETLSKLSSLEGGFGVQRNSEIKMKKREASCKIAKLLKPSLTLKTSLKKIASINARKHKNMKIVSHLKNQHKPRKVEPKEPNYEVEEKTLYVIEMESENKTLQHDQNASQDVESSLSKSLSWPKLSSSSISQFSSQDDREESEYASSELVEGSFSGNHETEHMEIGETLEVEEKGKPLRDGNESQDIESSLSESVSSPKFSSSSVPQSSSQEDQEESEYATSEIAEDSFSGNHEIKDMESADNLEVEEDGKPQKDEPVCFETQIEKSSPRRLKFIRGQVLWAIATNVKADNIGATTGPDKVILRHVLGKKDGQGLFNNVIEETTINLVETQKGKVKALVSAFETLISLQENKPSANPVS